MSKIPMHAASAPAFTRILGNLSAMLDKADAHAKAKKFDIAVLLQARLAPDMFPLLRQAQIAADFAKNAAGRLAGQTPPAYADDETTLAQVQARLARTIDYVHSLPASAFEGAEARPVTFQIGPDQKLTLPGADYLFAYALPNFYFHVTAAYAILRHNGVELSKRDFLGAPPRS